MEYASPARDVVYRDALPFPHIVIDQAFDARRIASVAEEVQSRYVEAARDCYGQHAKGGTSDRSAMGHETAALIAEMNDRSFVGWLESLTGISDLVADQSLFGGGVHRVERGGFLKIHADFSWHDQLRLYRRANVLLYLNPDWHSEWGGALELWQTDMAACAARVMPLLNRMVIFSTAVDSFHGHPEPLRCPEGIGRNSIALYYYSKEPADDGRSVLTDYRERPKERFGSVRHWVHQWRIKRQYSPSP